MSDTSKLHTHVYTPFSKGSNEFFNLLIKHIFTLNIIFGGYPYVGGHSVYFEQCIFVFITQSEYSRNLVK